MTFVRLLCLQRCSYGILRLVIPADVLLRDWLRTTSTWWSSPVLRTYSA